MEIQSRGRASREAHEAPRGPGVRGARESDSAPGAQRGQALETTASCHLAQPCPWERPGVRGEGHTLPPLSSDSKGRARPGSPSSSPPAGLGRLHG